MADLGSMMSMDTAVAEKPAKDPLLKRVGARLFSGRTAEELGGSWWVPTGVLFAFRLLCVGAFAGVGGMALRRRLWAGVGAPAVGALLAALLAALSALHALRRDCAPLAGAVGPLYQIGASAALFLAPLAAALHAADPASLATHAPATAARVAAHAASARAIVAAANALPAAVFLADSLLLGARVRFRWALAPFPVLLEIVSVMAPIGHAAWQSRRAAAKAHQTPEGAPMSGSAADAKGSVPARPFLLVTLLAVGLSMISAVVAVAVTRVPMCWAGRAQKRKEREAIEAEKEMGAIPPPLQARFPGDDDYLV